MFFYKDEQGNLYSLKEIRKDLIEITEEEFNNLKPQPVIFSDEQMQKWNRIAELKSLLAKSDYIALKHADGVISDEEYAETNAQRQAWRDEINQLER